jgi:hypothetical protein
MTAQEQASNSVQKVDAAIEKAIGAWTGAGVGLSALVGISPQSQVLSAIRSMKTLGRDKWAARRDKIAPTDETAWSAWTKEGNDLLKNLADIAQDAEASSIPNIIWETTKASAGDVKEVAQSVWSAKWVIVAGLIAVAAIIFGVRKAS